MLRPASFFPQRGLGSLGLALVLLSTAVQADSSTDLDALFEDDEPTTATSPTPPPGGSAEAQPTAIALPVEPAPPISRPPPGRRVIEEIVVTAQKREEGLSEVPISLSVFDEKFIADNAITDFRDLSAFVPNARIDANGTLPQLSIRGFNAHPLNRAFEQAISLVTDGVTYGTSPFFQTPLYDIARVEVLRGPQGTLFGKNSTAGAFNITTRRADSDVFEGRLTAHGGELGRERLELGLGGPIIKGRAYWRLAALHEAREGLLDNTSHASIPGAIERGNARRRQAARLRLGFPDLAGVDLNLAAERVDVRLTGFGAELGIVSPATEDLYRAYDAAFDAIANNYVGSVDAPEFTTIEGEIYSLNARRAFGDWDGHLVAGFADLAFANAADVDFGPAPALMLIQRDDHPQSTLELRTDSPELTGLLGLGSLFGSELGSSTLTAGLFWQDRGFRNAEGGLVIDPSSTALFLAYDNAGNTGLPGLLPPPAPPPGSMPANDPTDDEIGIIYYDQVTRSAALFGQLDWHLARDWTLQLGLRYSRETKVADWNTVTVQGTGALAFAALGRETYSAHREREESQLSPKVLLRYQINDDANVYAAWVRAFRAGGFNQIASTGDPEGLEYEKERVRSWEGGAKLKLADGSATLNLGLFWMNLEDFQVMTQDPSDVGFTVVNAGEARARGIELDGLWLVNNWLSLNAGLGFNDNEFLEFPFGTCTSDNLDTDGDGDERCDLKGEPLDFASKLTLTLNPRIEWALPWRGWQLDAGLVAAYQSRYFADNAVRDPRVAQEGVTRYDLSLGLGAADGQWQLRLIAENLSDEAVAVYKSDVPLARGTFYQTLDPARLLYSEFVWRF